MSNFNDDQPSSVISCAPASLDAKPKVTSNLMRLFHNDTESNTSELERSRVPTYEEFAGVQSSTNASDTYAGSNKLFNSTRMPMLKNDNYLVSDDEDEDEESVSTCLKANIIDDSIESEDKENMIVPSQHGPDTNDLDRYFDNLSISRKQNDAVPMTLPNFNRIRSRLQPSDQNEKRVPLFIDDSPPQVNDRDDRQVHFVTPTLHPRDSNRLQQEHLVVTSAPTRHIQNKPKQPVSQHHHLPKNRTPKHTIFQSPLVFGSHSKRNDINSSCEYLTCANKQVQTSFSCSFLDDSNDRECTEKSIKVINQASETTQNFNLHMSSSENDNEPDVIVVATTRVPDSDVKVVSGNTRRTLTTRPRRKSKRVSICSDGLPKFLVNADESVLDEFDNQADAKNGFIITLDASTIEEENEEEKEPAKKEARLANIFMSTASNNDEDIETNDESDDQEHEQTNYSEFERFLIEHERKKQARRTMDNVNKQHTYENSYDFQTTIASQIPNEKSECIRRSSLLDESSSSSDSPILVKTKKKLVASSTDEDERLERFLKEQREKIERAKKKSVTDEDSDDQFERFLQEQKAKTQKPAEAYEAKRTKTKTKKDSFIVNTDSESSEKPVTASNSSSDDRNDDLQLFYIKTTKKITNDKKIKDKPEKPLISRRPKKNTGRSSLLDDLSSSDENDVHSIQSSSSRDSSLSSMDDSFSRRFKRPTSIPSIRNNRSEFDLVSFRTPTSRRNVNNQDARLVQTAQAVSKRRPAEIRYYSFVESFSSGLDENRLDPSVAHFIKNFKKKNVKVELLKRLYDEVNQKAFDNKLPHDMTLNWNGRLTSTAGHFKCKRIFGTGEMSSKIEISTKVCDSTERLRDVLVHEMCHAASAIISNRLDAGHGPIWKSWTQKVNFAFKHIPPITIYHNYHVKKKFAYKCTSCAYTIYRFSKSIDVAKQICGICHGRFILLRDGEPVINEQDFDRVVHGDGKHDDRNAEVVISDDRDDDIRYDSDDNRKSAKAKMPSTPMRTPNKFALFVRDNYNSVKKNKNLTNHKDVMQELSKNFKTMSTND